MSKPVSVRVDPEAVSKSLLRAAEVEAEYGFTVATLKQWRSQGVGPVYVKTSPGKGGAVRYRRSAIEDWLDELTVTPSTRAA